MIVVVPLERNDVFYVELAKYKLIANIEVKTYSFREEFEEIILKGLNDIENGEEEYLFIIDNDNYDPFNFIMSKDHKIVVANIELEAHWKLAKEHNNAKVLIFNKYALSDYMIVKSINDFVNHDVVIAERHKRREELIYRDLENLIQVIYRPKITQSVGDVLMNYKKVIDRINGELDDDDEDEEYEFYYEVSEEEENEDEWERDGDIFNDIRIRKRTKTTKDDKDKKKDLSFLFKKDKGAKRGN